MGQIRLTIVVDNQTTDERLQTEHGLSIWVETPGLRLLFDTSQGEFLLENARYLGLPLEQTHAVVLSHGHYDHTGGLARVRALAPSARLFLHPRAPRVRFSLRSGRSPKAIGMPDDARTVIEQWPRDLVQYTDQPTALAPGLGLTGQVPRKTDYEDVGGPFFLDPQGRMPDTLPDDQALWIETPEGLVVVAGCSHAGLINTLDYIRELTGETRLAAVVGGFHLLEASPRRLHETLAALQKHPPDLLVPCHCTGREAVLALQNALGSRVKTGAAGQQFVF